MAVDRPIVEFIQKHKGKENREIAQLVKKQFNINLASAQITGALASTKTRENIAKAKEAASDGLDLRLEHLTEVELDLYNMYMRKGTSLEDKLAIAKELRQFIKQGNDTSGLHDEETQTLFVIEGAWSSTAQPDETSTT